MKTYKIAVGMLSVDHKNHWGLTASWMHAVNRMPKNVEFTPIFKRGIYLDKLRNLVASDFMKSDCDLLWFLDYDNGFNPEALSFFLEDIYEKHLGIVSGVYEYRDQGLYVAGVRPPWVEDGWYQKVGPEYYLDPLVNLTRDNSSAGMVGFGCVMIERSVFQNIEFPWFETYWLGTRHVSEDVDFCQKAEAAGYDIYLDQRIKSPHMSGDVCYPPDWKPY